MIFQFEKFFVVEQKGSDWRRKKGRKKIRKKARRKG